MLRSLDLSSIQKPDKGKINSGSSFDIQQSPKKKSYRTNRKDKKGEKSLTSRLKSMHTLDSSLQSNNSDILKYFSANDKHTIIPFDDYGSLINDTMSKYQTDKIENKKGLDEMNESICLADETMIKNIYRSGVNNSQSKIQGISEESILKVSVIDKDYKNPLESFKVLKRNRKIHDDVSSKFLVRQEQLYDHAIKEFESETMIFKVKMPKIKITNVMPKMNFELPKIKNDQPNNKEENINLNTDGSPIQSSINLAQDKSRFKLPDITLPIQIESNPKLFAMYKYPHKNFPEGREQFSFYFNMRQIILWGGISSNKNVDVWNLEPEKLEWSKYKAKNIYLPNSRYGHTGVIYENKLYIFGGKSKTNNYTFIPDLEVFDFEENIWTTPLLNTHNNLKLRKNHVADLIGHLMIIHGGHTDNNEYLNDTHLLSFHPLKWIHCNISEDTPGPTLSGHSCALVIPAELKYNPKFNIYKFPEMGIGRVSLSKIKEKGWYLFGGHSKEEGGLSNELWVLRLGKKPLEWIKPETSGYPPSPRYSHSTNFYEDGNFLIVHGGRNNYSSDNFALNDTYVLDLHKLEWIQITLYSDLNTFNVFNRCGHSSIVFKNKLIVFGGMNNNNYIGSSLFIINLNFNFNPESQNEDLKAVETLNKNIHLLRSDGLKKLERLRKKAFRSQLSIIEEYKLPEIK